MNKILKYVSAGLVPLVLTFAGYTKKPVKEQNLEKIPLTGKPIAVERLRPTGNNDDFYVILQTKKEGRVYCESSTSMDIEYWMSAQRRAYGLIKAEKEDGDDEDIELTGRFNNDLVFQISKYEVEGAIGTLE